MIESRYWKSDLLKYAKSFKPKKNPPRWSEKLLVNFEKDIIISFFMIRKLIESNKLSSRTKKYRAKVFRSPYIGVESWLLWDSGLYDYNKECMATKEVNFLCNQFIHGGLILGYRNTDRNWGGVYVCSDFEREKYIYRVPIEETISILEIASNDYPTKLMTSISEGKVTVKTD